MLDLDHQSTVARGYNDCRDISSPLERLPGRPVVIIDARRPLALWGYLRELLEHWELLRFFVWRDLLIRYRRTLLGISWVILQPTLQACLLWWLIGARVSDQVYDPRQLIKILLGTVLWLYGANTILAAIHQLSSNSHLITKVYFPRALLVLSPAIAHLLDLAVMSLVLFAAVAIWSDLHFTLMLLAACYCGTLICCLGPALIAGALAARFRDVKHVAPYLMQLWFFCTPAIYLPGWLENGMLRHILGIINPLNCWVLGAQQALSGQCVCWEVWSIGAISSMAWCLGGLLIFMRLEYNLADYM